MINKDSGKVRLDLLFSVDLAPVEPDAVVVLCKQAGHLGGIAPVPALQYFPIEAADFTFIGGSRITG